MASPLITAASIYSSDAPQITGSKSETVGAAASGGEMDDTEPRNNPLKAVGIMILFLVAVRFLFNAAKVI